MVGALTLGDRIEGVVLQELAPQTGSALYQSTAWLLSVDCLNVRIGSARSRTKSFTHHRAD